MFGAVNLTKNADPDKYGCIDYGTGFDTRSQLTLALLWYYPYQGYFGYS